MTVQLAFREDGNPTGHPVLVSPSLGTTMAMWEDLVRVLKLTHRVVRIDNRGHGNSPVPDGPYTVDELADDVVRLADDLELGTFAFVGLSLGGAIGQTIALKHPDRVTSLVLCCTLPKFGDSEQWQERAETVRRDGLDSMRESMRARWFTERVLNYAPEKVESYLSMFAATSVEGYAGCCEALAAFDVSDRISDITAPTRVVAGDKDPVASVEDTRAMADAIPDCDHVVLEDASHMAAAARPEAFHDAVRSHLLKSL